MAAFWHNDQGHTVAGQMSVLIGKQLTELPALVSNNQGKSGF
jgi:hypothetical protein